MPATADFTPLSSPSIYDVYNVGGILNPGIGKMSDVKRKNSWDVKKGKGTLGATITFTGRDPATFSITFYFWTEAQIVAWGTFRKQFEFDPTKTAVTAISIFNPILDDLGINSVVCESIGGLKHEGKQLYSCEVSLLEYFPPPKKAATGTPNGSKSNNGAAGGAKPPGTTPDPIGDAQQKEIADLLKQASGP